MKASRQLSASILVAWPASICRRCEPHCNFMFSWTSSTRTSDFDFITEFSMRMAVSVWLSSELCEFVFLWSERSPSPPRTGIVCLAQSFADCFCGSVVGQNIDVVYKAEHFETLAMTLCLSGSCEKRKKNFHNPLEFNQSSITQQSRPIISLWTRETTPS